MVTKPRTLYVLSDIIDLGCAVFTLEGKPIGVVIMRTSRGNRDSDEMGGPMGMGDTLYAVLPCATVAKAAQQAKECAPPKPAATVPAAK